MVGNGVPSGNRGAVWTTAGTPWSQRYATASRPRGGRPSSRVSNSRSWSVTVSQVMGCSGWWLLGIAFGQRCPQVAVPRLIRDRRSSGGLLVGVAQCRLSGLYLVALLSQVLLGADGLRELGPPL